MNERTPWMRLFAAFAALSGAAPEGFWRLSLKEWRALAGAPPGDALPRALFEDLMNQFPDQLDD